jgi:hypothetical protein
VGSVEIGTSGIGLVEFLLVLGKSRGYGNLASLNKTSLETKILPFGERHL